MDLKMAQLDAKRQNDKVIIKIENLVSRMAGTNELPLPGCVLNEEEQQQHEMPPPPPPPPPMVRRQQRQDFLLDAGIKQARTNPPQRRSSASELIGELRYIRRFKQVMYPERDGTAFFPLFDDVKHVLSDIDLTLFRRDFPKHTHKSITNLYNEGVVLIKTYFPYMVVSNGDDAFGKPKVYTGFPTPGEEEQIRLHLLQMYIGESTDTMLKRSCSRSSDWDKGRERAFCNAVEANGNRLTYRYLMFESSGDSVQDKNMVFCLEKCMFEFYEIIGKSKDLFNKYKGNASYCRALATKRIRDESERFSIGLALWSALIGLGTKDRLEKGTIRSEKPFECTFCRESFKTMLSLKNHLDVHHDRLIDKFACEVCKVNCYSKVKLNEHMFDVHARNVHNEKFTCAICKKTFTLKANLKSHFNNVHSGEKHACQICGKLYASRQNAKRHMRISHYQRADF